MNGKVPRPSSSSSSVKHDHFLHHEHDLAEGGPGLGRVSPALEQNVEDGVGAFRRLLQSLSGLDQRDNLLALHPWERRMNDNDVDDITISRTDYDNDVDDITISRTDYDNDNVEEWRGIISPAGFSSLNNVSII